MQEQDTPPVGYCQCGCGERAPLAPDDNAGKGEKKGEPRRYLPGHHMRWRGPLWAERARGFTSPCWVWLAGLDEKGYGQKTDNGRSRKAHRWTYEWFVGPIPSGLTIDHLCRNRACVNPAHLEAVTHAENCRRTSKLTRADVRAIRRRNADGESQYALAREYGVSQSAVSAIVLNRNWREDVA